MIDLYYVYRFIKQLVKPFNEWDAYAEGVINSDGDILVSKRDRKTLKQKESLTKFDVLVLNVKKMLAKIPGGSSKLGSYAAALYLIKEHDTFKGQGRHPLSEETLILPENIDESSLAIFVKAILKENEGAVATNSVGGDNIEGIGPDDQPPIKKFPKVTSRRKKHMKKKKKRDYYEF